MMIRIITGILLLSSCSSVYLAKAEKYLNKSAPGLVLCQQMKAYLERHQEQQLLCGLVPDEDFTGFSLPQWQTAKPGLGLRLWMQSGTSDTDKMSLGPAHWQKVLEAFKRQQQQLSFQVTEIDLNHDGCLDRIMSMKRPTLCKANKITYANLFAYDAGYNLDHRFISHLSSKSYYTQLKGYPFLYQGRSYLFTGSGLNGFNVYQPSTSGNGNVDKGRAICRYQPSNKEPLSK